MPTYTYKCESCGNAFDIVQSFSDRPMKKHPECGGTLRKVFHPAGIVFKGSGFYKTDSKKGSKPSEQAETKKEPSTSKPDSPKETSSTPKKTPSPSKESLSSAKKSPSSAKDSG